MNRFILIGLSAIAVAILIGIAIPQYACGPISGKSVKAMSEARQVAIALKIFAREHQGILPQTLDELVPKYLPDNRLMSGMKLTVPSEFLDKLPNGSIIAFKLGQDDKRGFVIVVHPDTSVEVMRAKN